MRSPLLLGLVLLSACASDFEKYNVISGPRLLAIRAEPPTVEPGGSTTLDALVHHDGAEAVEYSWSWCPLRAGTTDDFECGISEDDLRARLATMGVDLGAGYDLGHGETATVSYPATADAWAALCVLPAESLPRNVPLPNCDQGFPLSIGLIVRIGTTEIRAFKEVRLAFDDTTQRNLNPSVDGLAIAADGGTATEAQPVGPTDQPTVVASSKYELFADVPDTSAEPFIRTFDADGQGPREVRETLTLTWFVESGSTRWMRTSFIDGELGMDLLTHNVWDVPDDPEPGATTHVLLVVRDERGGVAWLERTFTLSLP